MKLTRDKLKQIIKEELEEIMSGVDESDIKVSVSPESLPRPLKSHEEEEITSHTTSKAFNSEKDGKRYIAVSLPNGAVRVYNSDTNILKFFRGERDSEGKKIPEESIRIQDPQILAQATSMFLKKSRRR
jgi:hypothetical protein